jgi:hypothetical protein
MYISVVPDFFKFEHRKSGCRISSEADVLGKASTRAMPNLDEVGFLHQEVFVEWWGKESVPFSLEDARHSQ